MTDTRDDVISLLSARGWSQLGAGPDGTLWQSPSDASASVAVPNGLTRGSFEWPGIVDRIARGLGVDPRSATDLIVMRFTDVTELAAETGADQESVLLRTGVALVESAQLIVRTCSTSSRTDRLSIDGHYLRTGDELAAKARMAHTRPGSYVLPILMSLPVRSSVPTGSSWTIRTRATNDA
jgi:hypothetical protein